MNIIMNELGGLLAEIHQALEKVIADLPDEALIWSPGTGMNTLAVIVAHALGAERYWIGEIAGQEPSGRVREAEFAVTGGTTAELTTHSRETLAHSRSVLARLSAGNLEEIREVGTSGRRVTVAWAILHALEHTALHTGHAQITRQLWEQYKS